MPIDKVKIRNFKSLKKIDLSLMNNEFKLHCFLGKNGSGKSNFLDAIKYYFDIMSDASLVKKVIDNQNPYIQKMEIEIIFDFSDLLIKNSNSFIEEYRDHIHALLNSKNQISLKLIQYKDNSITWFPNDIELLKIIKKVFPIYFIDTRFLDLLDWNYLWETISDLSKTNLKIDEVKFKEKFDELLKESYGEKYIKSLKIIEDNLSKENININGYDFANRYKSILMSRLGGSEFIQDGNKLSFYSDGLNSFNYLRILLFLIPKLGEMGWKNPIIIIDELEIGLHPQFISLLVDSLKDFNDSGINLLLSTHSPILVAELLKKGINASIYRVLNKNHYTVIEKMNQVIDSRYKSILTMNEASCYFANSLVFVEGISEMQLLQNEFLKQLFPALNYTDVYPYNSNNIKLKFIYPEVVKFNIPYLLIVDMDKILKYKKVDNKKGFLKFQTDKLVNPLSNEIIEDREKYMFFSNRGKVCKKYDTYNTRQLITKVLKKTNFKIEEEGYYIKDKLYDRVINIVKKYCLEYNVLPVTNTIEGVIITESNINKVITWLRTLEEIDHICLDRILKKDREWGNSNKDDLKYRALIIRLVFHGKLDNLKEFNGITQKEVLIKRDITRLQKKLGNKADGWIIDFMNFYFEKYIECEKNEYRKREIFKEDFPELEFILNQIENMLK